MNKILEQTWAVVLTILVSFSVGMSLLLASNYYYTDDPISKTISGLLGAYLTISVIVNLMHKWFLKPSEDVKKKNEIEKLFNNKIDNIILNSSKYGFDGFHDEIDFRSIFDNLDSGDTLWWLDTYAPGHSLWEVNIEQAIKRGANIRMLILSPDAEFIINHRATEIGNKYTPERFRKDVIRFVDSMSHVSELVKGCDGKFEYQLYDELLGVPMYVISKKNKPIYAYSSFYLCSPTAVSFPHMRWKESKEGAINALFSYVNKKWERNYSASVSEE